MAAAWRLVIDLYAGRPAAARITDCTICGSQLEPVSPDRLVAQMREAGWDSATPDSLEGGQFERAVSEQAEQYDNALHVSLYGGYGEFCDVGPFEPVPRAIICHSCAHELVIREPWIARVLGIDHRHPHSHRPAKTNHDWQPVDSVGHSMECANGCGAYWTIHGEDAAPDGPCPVLVAPAS